LTAGGTTRLTADTGVDITGTLAVTGAITSTSDLTVAEKVIHSGDTDTFVSFPSANNVSIETGGNEAIRVDSLQRLLVGTSTARAVGGESSPRLHIEGSGATANSWVNITRFSANNGSASIQFAKSRSDTPGTYTVVQDNDTLGQINFCGADGTDMANYAALIRAQVDGTPGANDMPGRLIFSTTADGGTFPTERLRIDSAGTSTFTGNILTTGKLGVGTTSLNNVFPITVQAEFPGIQFLDAQGTDSFGINADGGVLKLQIGVGGSGPTQILQIATASTTVTNNLNANSGLDVAGNITGTGDLTIDTNTLHVDSSNNRVGIGTTSPIGLLHIHNSAGARDNFSTAADALIIEKGGNTGLSIDPGSSGTANIFFPNESNHSIASISHNNSTGELRLRAEDYMIFATNANTERMRIDSSGRVGINETALSSFNSIGDDLVISQATGSAGITIRSGTSDTGVLAFTDGANTSFRGDVRYDHNGDYMRFSTDGDERMRIDSSGRLLLGTTSASQADSTADELVIGSTSQGNNGMTLVTNNANNGAFFFADQDNTVRGGIRYQHSVDVSQFYAGGSVVLNLKNKGVGINETSPSADALIIRGGDTDDTPSLILKRATDGTQSSGEIIGKLQFTTNEDNVDSGNFQPRVEIQGEITDNVGGAAMALYTAAGSATSPTERMRIDSSGNVGIGTTSPSQILHLSAANPFLEIQGTAGSSGDTGIFLNANGNHWLMRADNNASSNTFSIKSGDTSSSSHRFIIFNDGSVTIGPTSTGTTSEGATIRPGNESSLFRDSGIVALVGGGQSGQKLIEFRHGGTGIGSISKNGTTGTQYLTSSDYRLKENAVDISDGITRLKTLKPYRFNFKAEPDKTVDGFFAHEVTAVPEAISGTKDEVDQNNEPVYQGIDQSKLVPLLVAAVQELIGKVEALEAA